MASEVTVCNQALSRLGGNLITSLDDGTTEAILCKANYEPMRDVVMMERYWTFATKRLELPIAAEPVPAPTDKQFANAFLIPSEVSIVIRASSEVDDRRPNRTPFRVEGQYIISDAETMYVKALVVVVDPNLMSAMFRQALAIRLASEICVALTSSIKTQQSLMQEYTALVLNAEAMDGMQGTTERIRSGDYIDVRRVGSAGSFIGPVV